MRTWDEPSGWGSWVPPGQTSTVFCLLTLNKYDQDRLADTLLKDDEWYAVARKSTLTRKMRSRLEETGVFGEGLLEGIVSGSLQR